VGPSTGLPRSPEIVRLEPDISIILASSRTLTVLFHPTIGVLWDISAVTNVAIETVPGLVPFNTPKIMAFCASKGAGAILIIPLVWIARTASGCAVAGMEGFTISKVSTYRVFDAIKDCGQTKNTRAPVANLADPVTTLPDALLQKIDASEDENLICPVAMKESRNPVTWIWLTRSQLRSMFTCKLMVTRFAWPAIGLLCTTSLLVNEGIMHRTGTFPLAIPKIVLAGSEVIGEEVILAKYDPVLEM
jgi:hypothetical protein